MQVTRPSEFIFGTSIPQVVVSSDKYPKLEVTLYCAPPQPEKILAFSYLECIEDRALTNPDEIEMEDAQKISEWVLKGGHTPALEALYLLFNIRGMSKVVSHQLVRHRIGVSIDQRTQRANSKKYLGNFWGGKHFIVPPSIRDLFETNGELHKSFLNYMMHAEGLYNDFCDAGISEDEARYIIPQASETSMNFKVVWKALLDSVCSTRLCHLMQGEMVEVVKMMAVCAKEYNEFLGSWLKPICMKTDKCNRNENNPTDDAPRGVCSLTIDGTIPCRDRDDTFNLTKYSRDAK